MRPISSFPKKELPCLASELRPVDDGVKRNIDSELCRAVLGVLGLKPPPPLAPPDPTARGSGPAPGSLEGVMTKRGSRTVWALDMLIFILPWTSESLTGNM